MINFDKETKELMDRIGQIPVLNVYDIAVTYNNHTLSRCYQKSEQLHNLRSLSKFVVALCVGAFIQNNPQALCLEMKISPYLNVANASAFLKSSHPYFDDMTIEHLLTQTIGFAEKEVLFSHKMKNIPESKYLEYIFNQSIIYNNGEKFCYSNASAFLLSVVFQLYTGINLYDYAIEHLFKPLNIDLHKWKNYGHYCAGATGLELRCCDVHSFGRLVLNGGVWENVQIIDPSYLKAMISPHIVVEDPVFTSKPFLPVYYGYFTFIDGNGNYFANGAGGKYICVRPAEKLVLTLLADTKETTILQGILAEYFSKF